MNRFNKMAAIKSNVQSIIFETLRLNAVMTILFYNLNTEYKGNEEINTFFNRIGHQAAKISMFKSVKTQLNN